MSRLLVFPASKIWSGQWTWPITAELYLVKKFFLFFLMQPDVFDPESDPEAQPLTASRSYIVAIS